MWGFRIHVELHTGLGLRFGLQCVARLMRAVDIHGVGHHNQRRYRPDAAANEDLVKREFTADDPDRNWMTVIAQHRASDACGYCRGIPYSWRRRILGCSTADHVLSKLVVHAPEMAY